MDFKVSKGKEWQSTPVFLPGKSNGQRSLVGYSLNEMPFIIPHSVFAYIFYIQ